jgi:hypothetical protein
VRARHSRNPRIEERRQDRICGVVYSVEHSRPNVERVAAGESPATTRAFFASFSIQ